jgi:hypothetical protein
MRLMEPDLQSSLLCDDVRQERNGKFMLIGLFDGIVAQSLPVRYPRLCLVTRWCSGEGEFTQNTRLLKPSQTDILVEGKPIKFRLAGAEANTTNLEYFINVAFEAADTHWIEILLDGHLRLRYPLRVTLIQKKDRSEQGQG